jgi:RecA/RadA recombinase
VDGSIGCNSLDELLGGGGLQSGQTYELYGEPGCGKTQFAFQLSVCVQLPAILGGREGKCLFVDTEGTFVAERVKEVAIHILERAKSSLGSSQSPESSTVLPEVNDILAGIYVSRSCSASSQIALLRSLPRYLMMNPDVRLLVIDSISSHFRFDSRGKDRQRTLHWMAQTLNMIANKHFISILWTNQVAMKISPVNIVCAQSSNETQIVPSLGDLWGHASTNRLHIRIPSSLPAASSRLDQRLLTVDKSSYMPSSSVAIRIDRQGIVEMTEAAA